MWLLAQQVAPTTDPVSYTPLGIVATVVAFLLWRMKDSDADRRREIAELKAELKTSREVMQQEIDEQRHLKHGALNREAAAKGTLVLVRRQARRCTCKAMDPIEPLLDAYKD